MRGTRINEWLQVLASVGVLVGLLLVAYEIRESNRVATSESVRGIEDCFIIVSVSEYETNISELIVKSVEKPGQLLASEKLRLNAYLSTVIGCYNRWQNMHRLGVSGWDGLDDLRGVAHLYFGSAFGRAWFEENKSWIKPDMVKVIETELATTPVRTELPDVATPIPQQ